jgi:phosphoglucomutase
MSAGGGGVGGEGGGVRVVEVDLAVTETATTAFADQKPGTSGLRKKTSVFLREAHYLENFVRGRRHWGGRRARGAAGRAMCG